MGAWLVRFAWFSVVPAVWLGAPLAAAAQVGTVLAEGKISAAAGGFGGGLDPGDRFGAAVQALGDLDGDGVGDLAVGATFDDDGGQGCGAVWIVFLEADGTVKAKQKISNAAGGFGGTIRDGDRFGGSLAFLGDLDGDGVGDLAVGADDASAPALDQGLVWILLLNADGTVKDETAIGMGSGGFGGVLEQSDRFGSSLAALGDLDGDGVTDLAVGEIGDDDGGSGLNNFGAVWILFLRPDGTVRDEQKISNTAGGFAGPLSPADNFGSALAALGDIDGDGTPELTVGAPFDDDGGSNLGAVWVLSLDPDGTVAAEHKISATAGFGGTLFPQGGFGASLAALGDLDGNRTGDLAVGLRRDDSAAPDQGALWLVFLRPDASVRAQQKISAAKGGFEGELGAGDRFGLAVAALGDRDGDGFVDLAAGAPFADDGGADQGALWLLALEGDTLPPVIACPVTSREGLVVLAQGAGGAVVSFNVSADDDHDPTPTIVCSPPSGSLFPIGRKLVICTAIDAAGNVSLCSFAVVVLPPLMSAR